MDYVVFAVLIVVFDLVVRWSILSAHRKPKTHPMGAYRPKVRRFVGPPPATELMKRVEELQPSNAQWPEIQQVLVVSDILATIYGPHLFAPRVGLNVIKPWLRGCLSEESTSRLVVCTGGSEGKHGKGDTLRRLSLDAWSNG